MSLQIASLEPKQPSEIVVYKFNLNRNSAIQDETLLSVAWTIYRADDTIKTDISAMQVSGGVDDTDKIVYVQVQAGTSSVQYVVRGLVTCASANVYEVQGIFSVKEI